jgi:GGDEF domain-containing protein
MLWYVAFVAAINLALGYAWGAYIRKCPRCAKARAMGLSLLEPTPISTATPIHDAHFEFMPAAAPNHYSAANAVPMSGEVGPADAPVAAASTERALEVLDPKTGLVSRNIAEILLEDLAHDQVAGGHVTAGLVEMAPLDWIGPEPDGGIPQRMLSGVSQIVRQSLSTEHTLARFTDQQFLMLIPSEDVEHVTRRAEELRQRVATTEFVADGHSYQTTVTCALVDVAAHGTGPKLFEFLQEALDEAKRYGGNRTFMHDGKSPTPVVPAELAITPQQLAI